MSERLDLYRCEICGTIIQVLNRGDGELVCCGHPMKYLQAHLSDEEKQEKHVPVFTEDNKIQIGSELHPMTEEHYIQFIEAISEDKKHVEIKFLAPTEQPIMELCSHETHTIAKEYCNIHGLWEATKG
ncbi:desulfoferrodoxin FeS4 iron-binding domain-containing protein [bacterium]|nr:desulfoferrodoxin FeS4 iron-binding domain-containing protein [bacterium]